MPHFSSILNLVLLLQIPSPPVENPLFDLIRDDGLTVNGVTIKLPSPTLTSAGDAEAGKAALKQVAGDERAARELVRDSVTAPFILKTRDVTAGTAIVRMVDLWFVVHARLDEIDPDQALRQAGDQAVEVGNMKFESKIIDENDLRDQKVPLLGPLEGRKEWFTHLKGRLLDRIQVEATDRSVATRDQDSLLIASRTDPGFAASPRFPNRWAIVKRQGNNETMGPSQSYPGSICYVKMTPLIGEADALFVETHLAFVEPREWFDGNPILRSKISLIAQDQIRRLRREIQKKRGVPKKSGVEKE